MDYFKIVYYRWNEDILCGSIYIYIIIIIIIIIYNILAFVKLHYVSLL